MEHNKPIIFRVGVRGYSKVNWDRMVKAIFICDSRNYPNIFKNGRIFLKKFNNIRAFHKTVLNFDENNTVNEEDAEVLEDLIDSKSTSLVRASVPLSFPDLVSVPICRRPVFPGFYKTITIKDKNVLNVMGEILKKGKPYLGIFLNSVDSVDSDEADVIKSINSIYKVGVVAQIVNLIPISESTSTAIVYPHRRIRAVELLNSLDESVSRLKVENFPDEPYDRNNRFLRAVSQEIFATLADVAKLNPFFREHITHHNISSSVFEDPAKLADFVAVLCSSNPKELQEILDSVVIEERLRKALVLLKKELLNAQLQNSISKDVESKLNQRQREYFLHEQLKSIKKELGIETDIKEKLVQQFTEKSLNINFPEQVKIIFDEELNKLSTLEPSGAEFNVSRNYLEWLTQIPWNKSSEDFYDIARARSILDEDHYGMEEVKSRILEFIAVAKLRGSPNGKILCFVGPPGVGKTSIGKSIARSLNREFFRFSVGGLTDVAEIKGHRRTYVGAMPGKLIQALKKVKFDNPVILIDEVDKIGKGHAGDPSSALLELLDPEQNNSFLDHFMDVPVDLSKILFICTANVLDTIPGPLLDRMEIITLSGYISEEKREIAKRYIVPSLIQQNGLRESQLTITDECIDFLNRSYCRESGVRNLKKQIDKIIRKASLNIIEDSSIEKIVVDSNNLTRFIGPPIFLDERMFSESLLPPGVVTGLACTSLGGSILYFECLLEKISSGSNSKSPSFIKTGQLGKVMEESSSIAYSYSRAFLTKNFPTSNFFDTTTVHLHVPEGSTPKDGPSAGITMTTALLSLALNKQIPADLAMTGEISLTGKVLKIGGVREKVVAAKRSGIKKVILPLSNESEWFKLPEYLKEGLDVYFAQDYTDIAKICGFI